MTKRILALLFAAVMLLGCAAAETAPETGPYKIEKKNFPFYLGSAQQQWPGGVDLYFVDDVDDLPFVTAEDWAVIMTGVYTAMMPGSFTGMQVEVMTDVPNVSEDAVILRRENGSFMICDFETGTILWDDYNLFQQPVNGYYLDINDGLPAVDAEGQPFLLARTDSRDRKGNNTLLQLRDYDIPMICQDGLHLVPLQTVSSFCLNQMGAGLYFNRECLVLGSVTGMVDITERMDAVFETYGLITPEMKREAAEKYPDPNEAKAWLVEEASKTPMGQMLLTVIQSQSGQMPYRLFVSGQTGQRSRRLAEFGLDELCLELDTLYGLKETHNILSFLEFIIQTGLLPDFMSTDSEKADEAMYQLTFNWLDDGHSGTYSRSFDGGAPLERPYGYSMRAGKSLERDLMALRAGSPEAAPGYFEVGDTAYVTFNQFIVDPRLDYYGTPADQLPADDTIALIVRAHQQITREDSPIKNVVLDLSTNKGGSAPAAIFAAAWFLGDAHISVANTMNNAESTAVYRADVNLDHQFDEKDTLAGLDLYCLISPMSFSCGNLVPWAFKADGRVTLLGKTSGGGSCVVLPLATAWGTSYQISGPLRISFAKNGAYYDVDRGVDPDVFIRSYNTFFDRAKLTEIIHGLD